MANPFFNECLPVQWIDDVATGETICNPLKEQMALGSIIGKVTLVMTLPSEKIKAGEHFFWGRQKWEFTEQELAFGDYSPGRYGWLLSDPVLFDEPIPAKGKLGLWEYDY